MERYTAEEVWHELDGDPLGDSVGQTILAESLAKLPKEIVDWTLKNLRFVWLMGTGQWVPRHQYQKRKGIVLLDKRLRKRTQAYQSYLIAHEIAHAVLKHEENLSKVSGQRQEREATELAKKWLKEE